MRTITIAVICLLGLMSQNVQASRLLAEPETEKTDKKPETTTDVPELGGQTKDTKATENKEQKDKEEHEKKMKEEREKLQKEFDRSLQEQKDKLAREAKAKELADADPHNRALENGIGYVHTMDHRDIDPITGLSLPSK